MADKQVEALAKQVKSWGWRCEETKSGWAAYPPDKSFPAILWHRTPSDHRWYKNTVARLRRAGGRI